MKLLIVLLAAGAVLGRPSDLSGLEHDHSHDHGEHHHHDEEAPAEADAAGEDSTTVAPRPYEFSYTAGRLFGQVDREHSETRDQDGTVRGSYQYLDPLKQIVRVDYTADDEGYHPTVRGAVPDALPKDSETVAAARDKFFQMVAEIMAEHARIGKLHSELRAAKQARLAAEAQEQENRVEGEEDRQPAAKTRGRAAPAEKEAAEEPATPLEEPEAPIPTTTTTEAATTTTTEATTTTTTEAPITTEAAPTTEAPATRAPRRGTRFPPRGRSNSRARGQGR